MLTVGNQPSASKQYLLSPAEFPVDHLIKRYVFTFVGTNASMSLQISVRRAALSRFELRFMQTIPLRDGYQCKATGVGRKVSWDTLKASIRKIGRV